MERKILDWAYKISWGIFAGAFMWVIFNLAISIRIWIEYGI